MSTLNDQSFIRINQIRNFSIISHVDHGKTTLSDHLIAEGGLLPPKLAGTLRALDTLPEEQKRGISIDSSLVTFSYTYDENHFLINLIDTPGHIDFSGKVAEALRLVDNGLILVDAVEGVMAQTRTVLKQAIQEKLQLILFINKVDRLITEMEFQPKQIKTRMETIIGEISSFCMSLGLDPTNIPSFDTGTVLLGSALDGWCIDMDYVSAGHSYADISELYDQNQLKVPMTMKLSRNLKKVISKHFVNPKKGQRIRFPELILGSVEPRVLSLIHQCDPSSQLIVLSGRLLRMKNRSVGNIVRVLAGTLNSQKKLASSLLDREIEIHQLYRFQGSNLEEVQELRAGELGVVTAFIHFPPGDVLGGKSVVPIRMKGITYVQNPVVSVSIEPRHINQVEDLQQSVKTIVDITPGLDYEIKADTGELVVYGVGTLQLEIFLEELKESFDIDSSEPEVVKYVIPQTKNWVRLEKWGEVLAEVGPTTTIHPKGESLLVEKDGNGNRLISLCVIDEVTQNGILEVFKQTTRLSPQHGLGLKDLGIILHEMEIEDEYRSYEGGLIVGSALLRQALENSNATICEPFYLIEIQVPENYLGAILQELQIRKAKIMSVDTDMGQSNITAEISVKGGSSIADRLRQVSEGYAFWSYPKIVYKPE